MGTEGGNAAQTPWQTPMTRIGIGGLQLNKALDQLDPTELARMANWYHTGADLLSRPGQSLRMTGTVGIPVHSIRRLNNASGTFTRFWGMGSGWYRALDGAPGQLEGGFSGHPLTHCTVRPPFSGEAWMVAADANKMRKASISSPSLPLGLPIPTGLTTAVTGTRSRQIATFDVGDNTGPANWTPFAGPADAPAGAFGGVPVLAALPGAPSPSGNGINMGCGFGASTGGFLAAMAIPLPRDLSQFDDATPTTDDDMIQIRLSLAEPQLPDEIRIYFVCSPFSLVGLAIPGTQAGLNTSAYLHVLQPSNYAQFIANLQRGTAATQAVRQSQLLQGYVDPNAFGRGATTLSASTLPGAQNWTTFGSVVGLPLRRGDFLKIGSAGQPGTDWSTITGIYITVHVSQQIGSNIAFSDFKILGGYGPDDSEPGAAQYDYRVVNYDPRTGARSNGSAIQPTTQFLDAVRQQITITPNAAADNALRQEAYRRGGNLVDNWRYVGINTGNGLPILDGLTDQATVTNNVVPVDHFQPVATSDAAGNTVLNQPCPVIFGPLADGTVCCLGDPLRPGHLYASLPGDVDSWPSTGNFAVEVCAPSEQLMNGGVLSGGAALVLSRERGYAVHNNVAGADGISVQPTACQPGLASRWGFAIKYGMAFYVARDGIRQTAGNTSEILSDAIRPLFFGLTVNGYAPIDFAVPDAIRLEVDAMDLWFLYQDTNGIRRCLIWSLLYHYWRPYVFARAASVIYSDETVDQTTPRGANQLWIGSITGNAYTHIGFTDDGQPITLQARIGAWNWQRPREEKLLGDLVIDATPAGASLTLQTFLNVEAVVGLVHAFPATLPAAALRRRFQFDCFGTTPQHARDLSVEISGLASTTATCALTQLGAAYVVEPDVTMNRATTWEAPVNGVTEGYLWGCMIDCDTGGTPRTVTVECDLAGAITTASTLTITSSGRRKLWFSWPAIHAQAVRLRPADNCLPWMLFSVSWLATVEPPRIALWDSGLQPLGDSYYTGLDLEIDTLGSTKTIVCTVDGVQVFTGPIATAGRKWVHLTFGPGRGHIYQFICTDPGPGLLYSHKWMAIPEPGEQTNWNAPYTIWDSLSDKWLKGLILEVDTFGQTKSVNIDVDGVAGAVVLANVNHQGRSVKNYTFPQVKGRVFRVIPTDPFPSRPYNILPIFDEEPYALARWETQEIDFSLPAYGWGSLLSVDFCYRSTAALTLQILVYDAQGRLLQTLTAVDQATGALTLPTTGGTKQKRYATFPANKGVLFKFMYTTADGSGAAVYQEESRIRMKPWAGQIETFPLIGANDDTDPSRQMTNSVSAAQRAGGGT